MTDEDAYRLLKGSRSEADLDQFLLTIEQFIAADQKITIKSRKNEFTSVIKTLVDYVSNQVSQNFELTVNKIS